MADGAARQTKHSNAPKAVARADSKSRPQAEPGPEQAMVAGEAEAAGMMAGRKTRDGRPSGSGPPLSHRNLVALQRTIGNRAVGDILRSVAQRVTVSMNTSQTLYNRTNAQGQATAGKFGGAKSYEITRQGDSGVTVTVKIRFVNQARNTTPPPPGDTTAPRLGADVGEPTEIPPGDPRRQWATDAAREGVAHWAGRLTFVGEEWNLLEDNTVKRLPVTFESIPVFDLAAEHNKTIVVFGPATTAGSPGHPIDASHYYMNQGGYTGARDVIAAHEYGHLIGIADEYSQSNEQMNALLHQAAPAGAASAMAALDRTTIERMALSAMRRPLYNQLAAAMPTVVQSIAAQGALVKQKMAAAARAGVTNPGVRDQLRAQLEAESDPTLDRQVPGVVAFQTTQNFSNITRASEGVEAAFSPAALTKQIQAAYWKALSAPINEHVTVAGLGEVSINVQGAVARTTAAGGSNAANAGAVATATVGPSATPPAAAAVGPPGLPAPPPPSSLVGQITALPSAWAAAGSALESAITPEAFAAKMQSVLPSTSAAAALAMAAAILPGVVPQMGKSRDLYLRAHSLVNGAATEAAQQLAAELVDAQVQPVLQASVASFQTAIATEVSNLTSMTPEQLAAAPNPDPRMRAIVSDMKSRLDADKAATAGTGRDPLGAGGAAPAQNVTYSEQGLMGSHGSTALRPDQFQPMLKQFNDNLTTTFERDFRAEVR